MSKITSGVFPGKPTHTHLVAPGSCIGLIWNLCPISEHKQAHEFKKTTTKKHHTITKSTGLLLFFLIKKQEGGRSVCSAIDPGLSDIADHQSGTVSLI